MKIKLTPFLYNSKTNGLLRNARSKLLILRFQIWLVVSFGAIENWSIYSAEVLLLNSFVTIDVDEVDDEDDDGSDDEEEYNDEDIEGLVNISSWFLIDSNISFNWLNTSGNDGLSNGLASQHFSRRFINEDGVRVSWCPCDGLNPFVAARNAALYFKFN